jgi:DNA replication and repair protein RecF
MITDLRLQSFRSYSDASFEVDSGVNIIVGPNASGKTNLLEAVLVIARGSSFRAADNELVAFETPWGRLDAHTVHGARTVKLERLASEKVLKSFVIDDQSYSRLSLQKSLPTVLFEPNHLQLLVGSPELRRNYLDELLEQLVPAYVSLRRHYRRVLAQRNSLLKQDRHYAEPQLFVWNLRLSELGGQIATHRLELVNNINKKLGDLYQSLSHSSTTASLTYNASCVAQQYGSDLLHKLEKSTTTDFQRGFTAYGPHRDDITVVLGGHQAQDSASRGEVRTVLLALKIIELQLLEDQRGIKPLLLLDDVFSELDGARRKALTEVIAGYQTFITTTDADVVLHHFTDNCTIIPTTNGA